MLKKILERDIEKYFVKRVKAIGGEVRKLQWVNRSNAPDRLVYLPGRGAWLVELKAPGKELREGQKREIMRIRHAGGNAIFINSFRGVDIFLSGP